MKEIWSELKKTAKNVSKVLSEKTKVYSKKAKLQLQLLDNRKKQADLFAKLGKTSYSYFKKKKLEIDDPKINELLKKISLLIKEQSKIQKAMKDSKEKN